MQEVLDKILVFRKERNWEQYHTPENLAKSIAIEAGELLECFQWDVNNVNSENVKEELADVFIYVCSLANMHGIDLEQAFREKEEKNKQRTWKRL